MSCVRRMPDFIYPQGAFFLEDIRGWLACEIVSDGNTETVVKWRVFLPDGVFHVLDNEAMKTLRQVMENR